MTRIGCVVALVLVIALPGLAYSGGESGNGTPDTCTPADNTPCVSDGKKTSPGGLSCQVGRELRCEKGEWHETGAKCKVGKSVEKKTTSNCTSSYPNDKRFRTLPPLS